MDFKIKISSTTNPVMLSSNLLSSNLTTAYRSYQRIIEDCCFHRRYGTKCSGCDEGILPTNLVRRAKGMVFHVECFCCSMCMKEISTGDELYHIGGNKFVCKDDYDLQVQELESR